MPARTRGVRNATKKGTLPTTKRQLKSAPKRKPAAQNNRRAPKQQYRSTLRPMRDIFKAIKDHLKKPHLDLIAKTPFHHLFDAFWTGRVVFEKHSNIMLDILIESYCKFQGFRIGTSHYLPTKEDVRLVFGIQDGNQEIGDMSAYGGGQSSLRKRLFFRLGRLTIKDLKKQICSSVVHLDSENVHDTVKCLCLLLISTLFFSTTGNGIAWYYCYFVDKISRLSSFDWSAQILKVLIDSLNSDWSCTRHVNGCTLFLLFWFCEHTSVVEDVFRKIPLDRRFPMLPGSCRGIPRITKWNVKDLERKLTKELLEKLSADEFRGEELCPTESELMYVSKPEGDTPSSYRESGEDTDNETLCDTESVEDSQHDSVEDDLSADSTPVAVDVGVPEISLACPDDSSDESSGTESDEGLGTGSDGDYSSSSELEGKSVPEGVLDDDDVHPIELFDVPVKSVDDIISSLNDTSSVKSYEGSVNPVDASISDPNVACGTEAVQCNVKCVDAVVFGHTDSHPVHGDPNTVKSVDEIIRNSRKRSRNDEGMDPSIPSFRLLSPTPSPVSPEVCTRINGDLGLSNLPLVCYTNSTCSEHSGEKITETSVGLELDKHIVKLSTENFSPSISNPDSDGSLDDLLAELALLQVFEAKYIEMKGTVASLTEELNAAQLKNLSLVNESKRSNELLISKNAETEELSGEVQKLRFQLSDLELKNQSILIERKEVSELLNFRDHEIAELKQHVAKLRWQISELESEKDLLVSARKESNDLLTSKIVENDYLKELVEKLRGRLVVDRVTLSLKESVVRDLQNSNNALEIAKAAEIKDLSSQVETIKHELACALSTVEEKEAEILRLKAATNECTANANENFLSHVPLKNMDSLVVADPIVDKDVSASDAFVDLTPNFLALSKTSSKKLCSLERRVKQDPRKRPLIKDKDILFDYAVQQKKQKATVKPGDPNYLKPTDNPVDVNGKLIMLENKNDYLCGIFVLADVYDRLLKLHKESDKEAIVWAKSIGDYPFVLLPSVLNILNNLYVDETILEGVIHLLRRSDCDQNSILLASTTFNAILDESVRDNSFSNEALMEFMQSIILGKTLLLPLCLYGSEDRPYHWVLISFKLGDSFWRLYNPLHIDGRYGDAFLKEVQGTVAIIVKLLEQGIASGSLATSNSEVSIPVKVVKARNFCLQHDENNCAMFVSYYMFKLSQKLKIPSILEDSDLQKWKGSVVNSLTLNDPELLQYEFMQ